MTKKEKFIRIIEEEKVFSKDLATKYPEIYEDAQLYYNVLKNGADKESKSKFTDTGKAVLAYMQANKDIHNNLFTAKDIAAEISLTSRSISGAARKLVSDGYLEKMGESPVVYSLTELGCSVALDNE
jgi:DNA-binding MarR family transcriptional regulator